MLNELQARARALFENYRRVSAKAPKPFFNIQTQQDNDEATIYIYDVIDSWFGVDVSELVDELNNLDVSKLNVRLSSPGGSVGEGIAIMSALSSHRANIHTYADSIVASMASGILMSGEKIHMAENATLMIHDPLVLTMGNSRELRKVADLLDKFGDQLARNYSKQTESRNGINHAAILSAMSDETWFTAEEAKEAGFIDEIIETIPVKNTVGLHVLATYKNTPDHLKEKISAHQKKNIETIRDFENFLRDVGGFSNAAAKKIAAAGFSSDQRDAAGVDAELMNLFDNNSRILKGI